MFNQPMPTVAAIHRAYEEANDEDRRGYLGASIIGKECERELWLYFRWATEPEKFDGRMLRLFQTGHREEARMVDDLRRAGVEVWDVDPRTGKQFSISNLGGHFKGHLDGVALGILEAPKTPHVLELKTHNTKSFTALRNQGVRKAKPEHYAQMQIYMHHMDLKRAFYLAHNKDTDELYAERIEYDAVAAIGYLARAERIITDERPPARLHGDPEKWPCMFCSQRWTCHGLAWAPRNCRTCLHSSPQMDGDGRWTCARDGRDLSREDQAAGCIHHLYIPDLVPGLQVDADLDRGTVTYELDDGSTFVDGGEENAR